MYKVEETMLIILSVIFANSILVAIVLCLIDFTVNQQRQDPEIAELLKVIQKAEHSIREREREIRRVKGIGRSVPIL